MDDRDSEYRDLLNRLESLEARISRLETAGIKEKTEKSSAGPGLTSEAERSSVAAIAGEDNELESQIGRVGLAWLGCIVLFFGIVFLTEYLAGISKGIISAILGYCSVTLVFFTARYLKRSSPRLLLMFNIVGQVLLFYITLRLHFFSSDPLVENKSIAIILLLIIVAFQTFTSLRTSSQAYGALSVLFCLTIAVLSDASHIMLILVTISALGAVFYLYNNGWKTLFNVTIFLVYTVFFMWLFSNPLMGNTLQLAASHNFGYIYLFIIGALFCLLPLFRQRGNISDDFIISGVIINGILFTLMLVLVTLSYFPDNYVGLFAVITISCLGYSILLKKISDWNFASAFFALYGFMAMSISMYGMVGLPGVYLLLSIQSLIVVSMALWFSNRLMIVMNSILFLTILLVYMIFSKHADGVNFSFALVSIISARVINWQKERLSIKTDFIRNLYLIEGFIMVLFSLYYALPGQFIVLSWTFAASLYFGLSFLLKNVKYRYMALATMICAAIYLFIVDLARIELIYRVLALLFLAVVSIGISLYYTNRGKRDIKSL